MVNFIDILKAEILKTKRTRNFTIVLLFPIVITLLIFGYYVKELIGQGSSGGGGNPWMNYSRVFFQFYTFFYPLLAALIAFSLSNIEHKNLGFKQIFTFPASKFSIYFSKVIILLFWIFCSLLLAYSLLMLSGNLLSTFFPEVGFQDYDLSQTIQAFFTRIFFSLVAIISIHFFLSIYWGNFIISVGSACFLVVFGLVVGNWKYSYTIPYCNLLKAFQDFNKGSTVVFSQEIIWSIIYSIVFFALGYLMIIKKSIK